MATRIDKVFMNVLGSRPRIRRGGAHFIGFDIGASARSHGIFRNFSSIVYFLAFLSLSLVGCTPEPPSILRIGTNTWTGYEALYLARDAGFYQDTNIRLVEYGSSTDVIRAFRNGAIQAAGLTLDEVLLLAQDGHRPCIVGVFDVSNGADAVVGQKNIRTLADLKGKRVGVESTALGGYMLARTLQFARLTQDTISMVSLQVNEHAQAFKDKRVDALVTFDPVRTNLLSSGANLLFDSRKMPGEIVDVLVVECAYLHDHMEDARALVKGWFKAVKEIQNHPEDAARRMAPHLGLPPKEVSASLQVVSLAGLSENRQFLSGDAPLLWSSLQRIMMYMIDQRLLNATVDVRRLIDPRLVNEEVK